jgi:hypothetical protein
MNAIDPQFVDAVNAGLRFADSQAQYRIRVLKIFWA